MQRFAHWTNLSETTFVLPPTVADADYRVRIFTPVAELPFAGHPTLGTCHAWLSRNDGADVVVQECDAGLVPVRRTPEGLAFSAPPLLRSGPVEEELVAAHRGRARHRAFGGRGLAVGRQRPGLGGRPAPSAEQVLDLSPGFADLDIGVVGPHREGEEAAFEVRAFFPKDGTMVEDPVTGSLNASLAEWLLRSGRASVPYVARQGTALGRRDASVSPVTRTARSGSPAGRSPASPARWSSSYAGSSAASPKCGNSSGVRKAVTEMIRWSRRVSTSSAIATNAVPSGCSRYAATAGWPFACAGR